MYCRDCQDQQSIALREVEELLTRLEAAEALYPSSQVLGSFHPEYKSPEFVGRVRAMCLWYNITRHQRLKLQIVGKIFARYAFPLALKLNTLRVMFLFFVQTDWKGKHLIGQYHRTAKRTVQLRHQCRKTRTRVVIQLTREKLFQIVYQR